jgi:dephospho-CoA kinase
VGLTGGIATGKTYVRRRLEAAGLPTLDLDAVSHALMETGAAAHAPVVAAFGPGILDAEGRIDRRELGRRVFSDAAARARLESIVHPLIRAEEERWVRQRRAAGDEVVVVDAALLVEAGLHTRFDRLLATHCPPAVQLERLRERDGMSAPDAAARLAAQMPPDEKLRFVDETNAAAASAAAELGRAAAERREVAGVDEDGALGALLHGPALGPRGVRPLQLFLHIARAGGLEMAQAARLLDPPCAGSWLSCAGSGDGPGPEALAAPVAVWALGRAGVDHAFLSVAAYSVARLTHQDPADLAAACLTAHAFLETLARGGPGPFLRERLPWWETEAAARAGAAAQDRARSAILQAAGGGGAPGTVAGALRGVGAPPPSGPEAAEARAALRALSARA